LQQFWHFSTENGSKTDSFRETTNYTIDDQFNSDKRDREKEIDRLLSKMGKNGSMTFRQKTEKDLMNCLKCKI
jgi:predicted lipase